MEHEWCLVSAVLVWISCFKQPVSFLSLHPTSHSVSFCINSGNTFPNNEWALWNHISSLDPGPHGSWPQSSRLCSTPGSVNSMPCARFSLGALQDWSSEAHGVYGGSLCFKGKEKDILIIEPMSHCKYISSLWLSITHNLHIGPSHFWCGSQDEAFTTHSK